MNVCTLPAGACYAAGIPGSQSRRCKGSRTWLESTLPHQPVHAACRCLPCGWRSRRPLRKMQGQQHLTRWHPASPPCAPWLQVPAMRPAFQAPTQEDARAAEPGLTAPCLTTLCILQVPAMRLAFQAPTQDDAGAADPAAGPQGMRLSVQAYPGAMRYAPMARFLQGFASIFG